MRKTMIIPTYWCRKTGDPWQEGDAVYDHPTPVDQEGTLERTLVSMKQFHEKDFKLVILICPTTPEVEAAAYEQVLRIVVRAQLNAETYLFTAGDLREITEILRKAGLNDRGTQLLSMFGYSNVRNICLLATSILTADAALLIDDDEVFELPLAKGTLAACHACRCNPNQIATYPDSWQPDNCYYSWVEDAQMNAAPPASVDNYLNGGFLVSVLGAAQRSSHSFTCLASSYMAA